GADRWVRPGPTRGSAPTRGCEITSSATTAAATHVGHPLRRAAAFAGHRFSGAAVLEREDPCIDSSRAVPDLIAVHAELIQQRQMQVRQRHVLEPDVPSAL